MVRMTILRRKAESDRVVDTDARAGSAAASRYSRRAALISVLGVAFMACMVGCGAPKPEARVFHYEEKPWNYRGIKGVELTSMHYRLRTTVRDRDFLNFIPQFLESCWIEYEKILPGQFALDAPVTTYLFRNRWEWERFTEDFAPSRASLYKRIRSGGYSERGITVSHYSSRRSTLSILAHEGLHQYLELTRGNGIPAWLNEGLACYFEGFTLDADMRPAFTPEFNTIRSRSLRETVIEEKMIPLEQILATHAGREIHKRSAHVRSYYAQEWALVVFLLRSPLKNPYHDRFERLLGELGGELMRQKANAFLAADTDGTLSEGEAIFRAYIAEDIEQFKADFDEFVRDLLGLVDYSS